MFKNQFSFKIKPTKRKIVDHSLEIDKAKFSALFDNKEEIKEEQLKRNKINSISYLTRLINLYKKQHAQPIEKYKYQQLPGVQTDLGFLNEIELALLTREIQYYQRHQWVKSFECGLNKIRYKVLKNHFPPCLEQIVNRLPFKTRPNFVTIHDVSREWNRHLLISWCKDKCSSDIAVLTVGGIGRLLFAGSKKIPMVDLITIPGQMLLIQGKTRTERSVFMKKSFASSDSFNSAFFLNYVIIFTCLVQK